MKDTRRKAIEKAKSANTFGLILGTLGRQGSTKVLNYFHVSLIDVNCSLLYNINNYIEYVILYYLIFRIK